MQYVYNCINPPDLDELEHILDTAEEITREEFVSRVSQDDLKELEENLGYSEEFPMEKDPYVSYWRAWYCGQEILYFRHSCIEYVFKEFEPPVSSTVNYTPPVEVGA